jgi:hypothetical protein
MHRIDNDLSNRVKVGQSRKLKVSSTILSGELISCGLVIFIDLGVFGGFFTVLSAISCRKA